MTHADLGGFGYVLGEIVTSGNYTGAVISANTLYAWCFVAPANVGSIDQIDFYESGVVAGNARFGIYHAKSSTNLYPGALVTGSDSGSLSTGTTGSKTKAYAPALVLQPGSIYWGAFVADAAANIHRCTSPNAKMFGAPLASSDTRPYSNVITVAFTYAALPANFPAGAALTIGAIPWPKLVARIV